MWYVFDPLRHFVEEFEDEEEAGEFVTYYRDDCYYMHRDHVRECDMTNTSSRTPW